MAACCAVAVVVMAMAGCEAPNTDPNFGKLDPASPYSRVMIADDELARGLVFEEPIVVRNDSAFIRRVEVTVRAASGEPLRVDYRPIFKDAAGMVLQPESSWRTTFLEMRVPERILMQPTAHNAADYEIQFRWAR